MQYQKIDTLNTQFDRDKYMVTDKDSFDSNMIKLMNK